MQFYRKFGRFWDGVQSLYFRLTAVLSINSSSFRIKNNVALIFGTNIRWVITMSQGSDRRGRILSKQKYQMTVFPMRSLIQSKMWFVVILVLCKNHRSH